MAKKRKPTHPGEILEEHYIKPLKLHLGKLAAHLEISRRLTQDSYWGGIYHGFNRSCFSPNI